MKYSKNNLLTQCHLELDDAGELFLHVHVRDFSRMVAIPLNTSSNTDCGIVIRNWANEQFARVDEAAGR